MSEELRNLRGFMPCDEPVTWGELKEPIDDGALSLAFDNRSIVAIQSITFGEHDINGTASRGYLVRAMGTGPLYPSRER